MEEFNTDLQTAISEAKCFNAEIVKHLKNYGITEDKIEVLKKMYEANVNLFNTIKVEFINSDYFSKLPFNVLMCVTSIKSIKPQEDLLKLDDKRRGLLFKLLNDRGYKVYWPAYLNSLLTNLNKEEFKEYVDSINVDELTDEQLKKTSIILITQINRKI